MRTCLMTTDTNDPPFTVTPADGFPSGRSNSSMILIFNATWFSNLHLTFKISVALCEVNGYLNLTCMSMT